MKIYVTLLAVIISIAIQLAILVKPFPATHTPEYTGSIPDPPALCDSFCETHGGERRFGSKGADMTSDSCYCINPSNGFTFSGQVPQLRKDYQSRCTPCP